MLKKVLGYFSGLLARGFSNEDCSITFQAEHFNLRENIFFNFQLLGSNPLTFLENYS